MPKKKELSRDYIDGIIEQWRSEGPEADLVSVAIRARTIRCALFFMQSMERFAASHGLSLPELWILTELRRFGHRNPTQLYKALFTTSSTMTRRVERLVKLGLVKRTPQPADRRGIILSLAPRGRRITDAHFDIFSREEQEALLELSVSRRRALSELLRELVLAIEKRIPHELQEGNAHSIPVSALQASQNSRRDGRINRLSKNHTS